MNKNKVECSNTSLAFEPLTEKIIVELTPPSINNRQGDVDRLKEKLLKCYSSWSFVDIPLQIINRIPTICRNNNWNLVVTLCNNGCHGRIIDITPLNNNYINNHLGIALDIGTTTITAHLVNLDNGKTLDYAIGNNLQVEFGEDILTRIQIANDNSFLKKLQNAVIESTNFLIKQLVKNNGIKEKNISAISVAGNTTMSHLFLGIDPSNICKTPYTPAFNDLGLLRAIECNININPYGIVYILPSIGSYVGGDIVADILVSNLHNKDNISMLVDIGTNGEIILGNKEWIAVCAGAAGPALEGGVVKSGMKAESGAISRIRIDTQSKVVKYEVIGKKKPIGICGSGLIDCVAELLINGIIDRKGNFRDDSTYYKIAPASQTGHSKDIVITQNDIKSLIRTKGAVSTAFEVILEEVGCSDHEVSSIYIAGTFGNNINVESAITIGLLPDLDRNIFSHIGNSSVEGAKLALLSREKRYEAKEIASSITYFELNANNHFMEKYSSGLFLPHTDIDKYPSVKNKLK